ncbi:hypothetical protein K501DRAFT_326096 [Backusella circina FSU 941]|nr:hypothetical protein K501DRAFT_326096 [Backusella circina FSU 941]
MKYLNLGLTELKKHPSYKNPDNKKNIKILNKNCAEALDAMEKMKPKLDTIYENYVAQVKKTEKEAQEKSVADQTSQWQAQYRSVDVNKNWSLQDELKGIPGVGQKREQKPAREVHHQQPNYPSISLNNASDGFNYQYPSVPPKMTLYNQPALPPKIPLNNKPKGPDLPPKIPLVDEMESFSISDSTSYATTERGEPLRRLILPKQLQSQFLSIASTNTRNKIETCGILGGKLKNNVLKITTLIIPKQTGTTDTCTTENEEELFDIQDKKKKKKKKRIQCFLSSTHPTQTCFLSSVDLHTHCSYQLMLPEAIAIVCAPSKDPNFGVFRLTDPPGVDIISNCKATPAFHPHPDLPIYTDAHRDGHVEISDYKFEILDLRS